MFRSKWHVLVMLLLSMVGFSMVNALTFDLDRGPFGTLNLSKLMIKPNANSDSTIELSGHTLQITTTGGKIKVHQICDENGENCRDVSELYTGGLSSGWMDKRAVGVNRLTPGNTGNGLWIQPKIAIGPSVEWIFQDDAYRLRVDGSTKLSGDLTVTGTTKLDGDLTVGDSIELSGDVLRIKTSDGKLKVHEICDENGDNCKPISQLYTGNGGGVYGGGGDGYWKLQGGALTTSGNYPRINLNNDLNINNGNITVDKVDGQVRVNEICDKNGGNCRNVLDIVTGGSIYWGKNGNNLKVSKGNYGLKLSTWDNDGQSYSFEITDKDSQGTTKAKVLINGAGLTVEKGKANMNAGLTVTGATTLNNALTVKGTTTANNKVSITSGGLTVTGATELNNGLTVHNGLTATADGAITFRGTYINLAGANYIKLDGTKNFMGGDVNITGTTTITGGLNVNGGIDITTGSLRIMANKDSGFQISKKQNLNIYSPIFRVDTISDTYDIGVIGDTYIEGDTTMQGTTNLYGDTVIAGGNTIIGGSDITIDTDGGDIIIDGNTTTIRGDTTIKNKLYVGNDNNNCYDSGNVNCYASDSSLDEISQIRFVPKTFNNQKQISTVKPCDRSVEGTLVYWRDKNLRADQGYTQDARLSICMCALKTLYNVQQPNKCEWKNIALLEY